MKNERILSGLTMLICALIIWSGLTGILVPGFYAGETENWRAQTLGQDTINLTLLVPLLSGTVLIGRYYPDAKLLWVGGILYTIYAYTIYCFDIHFNYLFPVYSCILGLSLFSLIWFVSVHFRKYKAHSISKITGTVTGIYFMLIAAFFALIWAAEICVAILTDLPPVSIRDGGFFTNPVQVIDLAVCLPGIFIAGLLLVKHKPPGQILAPALLTFMLLMDLTVGILSINTSQDGPVTGLVLLMFALAVISLMLLVANLRKNARFL